jgi:hypothetical protein
LVSAVVVFHQLLLAVAANSYAGVTNETDMMAPWQLQSRRLSNYKELMNFIIINGVA